MATKTRIEHHAVQKLVEIWDAKKFFLLVSSLNNGEAQTSVKK